jgi:hypothetical protein
MGTFTQSQNMFEPNLDAFGRLRVSSPISQFDYQNQYNKGSLLWSEAVAGTGASVHNPNNSTISLNAGGTASGAKIYRQTVQYARYNPGKSLVPIVTFAMGTAYDNVRMRAGYFDDKNGVYLQRLGSKVSLVLRTFGTGSVTETVVAQGAWNGDNMDGRGNSGLTADWTKTQILFWDIQWLGVGTVTCYIEINRQAYVLHHFQNANLRTTTYMTTANLPIRYEVENTGTASGSATMLQICATVLTEQGSIDDGGFYTHACGNGVTGIGVTTRRNVLTIRPKLLLGGLTNRAKIQILDFDIVALSNSSYFEIVYNGTLGGSPSWTDVGTNSAIEYDVAGTTVTGGEVVHSGYVLSGSGSTRGQNSQIVSSQYPIGLDINGANPTTFSLVCTSFTGTSTVNSAVSWREYY